MDQQTNKAKLEGSQMHNIKKTLRALPLIAGFIFASFPSAPALAEKMDDNLFTLVKIDQLEYRKQDGNDLIGGQAKREHSTFAMLAHQLATSAH